MGDFLFALGIASVTVIACIGISFLIFKITNSDSTIAKIILIIVAIALAIGLIISGLALGVKGINC